MSLARVLSAAVLLSAIAGASAAAQVRPAPPPKPSPVPPLPVPMPKPASEPPTTRPPAPSAPPPATSAPPPASTGQRRHVGKDDESIRRYSAAFTTPGCANGRLTCVASDSIREIKLSIPAVGILSDTSALQLYDSTAYQMWLYRGKRNEEIVVTMHSDALDAYLVVAVAGVTLADDDDGGGGTNARLRIRLPADGSYLIVANSATRSGRGRYELTVEPEP
jgi:hypothetical protein